MKFFLEPPGENKNWFEKSAGFLEIGDKIRESTF